MFKIKFRYRDSLSHGQWREQSCVMSSVAECIRVYGLGVDCDYEILSVEECQLRNIKFLKEWAEEHEGMEHFLQSPQQQ